jgi:hypothetical protein
MDRHDDASTADFALPGRAEFSATLDIPDLPLGLLPIEAGDQAATVFPAEDFEAIPCNPIAQAKCFANHQGLQLCVI